MGTMADAAVFRISSSRGAATMCWRQAHLVHSSGSLACRERHDTTDTGGRSGPFLGQCTCPSKKLCSTRSAYLLFLRSIWDSCSDIGVCLLQDSGAPHHRNLSFKEGCGGVLRLEEFRLDTREPEDEPYHSCFSETLDVSPLPVFWRSSISRTGFCAFKPAAARAARMLSRT